MDVAFWHFDEIVTVIPVGFSQVVVDQFRLFEVFITGIVADVNLFPRRQNEDFCVRVLTAGCVKK